MKGKKLVAMLLASVMCLSLLAGCNGGKENPSPTPSQAADVTPTPSVAPVYEKVSFDPSESYIYRGAVTTTTANWNPHTHQTNDANDIMEYMIDSLFTMVYNDELHPVEGLEPYKGYKLVPAMAADYPVDVTTSVKAAHPEFNIPADATTGYAWSVKIRDDLKWDDGTPITAQDFVDSMERVLRPELLNYRAADYYDGSYVVVNADKYSLQGTTAFKALGTTVAAYTEQGGKVEDLYIDAYTFWNCDESYTDAAGNALEQYVSVTDETVYGEAVNDAFSGKGLYDEYFAPGAAYENEAGDYVGTMVTYEDNYSFDNVGLYVSGDNELTFVYRNALEGFYLMTYGMSVPLVKIDLYDSLLVEKEGVWSSTYNTSVETTASYGPYKLTEYQVDKSYHYVKNDNWYGWNSGIYTYVDPTDGKQYDMYQTTEIDLQKVEEAATRKTMFLAGQLMSYGLQAEDFDQYRSSEFCFATPGQAVFGMILNGYMDMLKQREGAADFDQATKDLEMMSVESFKRALAVSIDRDDMCATVSPARSAGFGLIGTNYVYDPETGALYRDTDQAKQALCNFYSVNVADYADLDAAVNSITGFDPVAAGELFKQAFDEGIEKGYITDNDGDGKSDQTVEMLYAVSGDVTAFVTKTLQYMNDSFARAAQGTPFEGKIKLVPSAPLGDPGWSDAIRNGTADTVLAGWSGATMDPFGFADTWTNERSYWNAWFNPKSVDITMTINGEEITMTLRDWAECLNGNMKTVGDKSYNFGYGQVDVETRLEILAKCEETVLGAYVTLPMLADGGMSLLSQQVYYVVEEYSPMMARGGIQYMKYNYSETEWNNYVSSQGGTLQY